MALEFDSDRFVCCRCGTAYGRRKGYFPVSYGALYRGIGYLPYCRTCVDSIFNDYLTQCGDPKMALRQLCRKLDLYWNAQVYDSVEKKATTRTLVTSYLARISTSSYVGKSYDETLIAENALWSMGAIGYPGRGLPPSGDDAEADDITEEVIAYWGPGYTPEMYQELEQRRTYWMNNLPEDIVPDVGMEALIRQICNLEIDINKVRSEGKSPDKLIGMLDKLITSMNLKPAQKTEDNSAFDKTPFGVWIDRWEYKRPIPEPDPELSDYDEIVKKISIWFLGHICAMFGFKNKYCKLYEDKIASMRIDREDNEDDDDEEAFNTFFGGGDDG